MEVADQWRREWAGTAEYGKVTEGGVTRRVARAMEVLHASGPGARVRVMRAAYHSSAAPGAPAATFMLHSSRRVISSGFNLLESPSSPIKPLEISSTPLESSPEPITETENYKVTEPDDFDISEPSKWRGSAKGRSIRMPSEESSSTDNASIIDLDSRHARNLHRKYSYDSESSDIQFGSRNNSRNSPLLDTPVTLSTLKYKSLLNSSNEWNTRRKSYSFEDTFPLNETIIHSNDTLAMESSTDSGICKSTEIVNDHIDDSTHTKYLLRNERQSYNNEETFKDWLSKNRPTSHYRGSKFKTYREHDIVIEDPTENNITLQSSGKVSITLPITIEADCESYPIKHQVTEENDKKVKKVEFCKTEVHFAAESGKVNIIATDEKPPPSTDFRKRRSAFVPMQDMIERPITLFGEKNDFSTTNEFGTPLNVNGSGEFGESDENTAATKSILKNKIPKPKPYLLGENMAFGTSSDLLNKDPSYDSVLSAVSLVNKQLKSEKHYNGELKAVFPREAEESVPEPNILRTIKAGPTTHDSLKHEKHVVRNITISKATENTINDVKTKLTGLQVSPAQRKPKTRLLRDSELTYFGVDTDKNDTYKNQNIAKSTLGRSANVIENIFQSVKLIQQVSNIEPESDESPEYQNIPLNIDYAPVPTPRLRSNYDDKPKEINEIKIFKPVIEKDIDETKDIELCTRRTKHRRSQDVVINTSRSISAPPKAMRSNSTKKSHQRKEQSTRLKHAIKEISTPDAEKRSFTSERIAAKDNAPIYVNLNITTEKPKKLETHSIQKLKSNSRQTHSQKTEKNKIERTDYTGASNYSSGNQIKERQSVPEIVNIQTKHSINKDTISRAAYKESLSKQTVKTDKSRYNSNTREKTNEGQSTSHHTRKSRASKSEDEQTSTRSTIERKDHRNRSLQRPTSNVTSDETSRDSNRSVAKKAEHQIKDSSNDSHKSAIETEKPSKNHDLSYTARIPPKQLNTNEKSYSSKSNSNKKDMRRAYVINYDDKNGTVSSICKITPGLGTPKRKKSSKEMFKDNDNEKVFKNKIVDRIAPRNADRRSSRGSKRTELCR